MAIGDPNAHEQRERRIGGNPRNIGPRRPRPGTIGRRGSIAGKLPAEYSEFRLEDGRSLGEVMGADFFGPPSGADGGEPMPQDFHEKLREGNFLLPGIIRENPDRFAPPPTATAGGISIRAEDRQAKDSAAGVGKSLRLKGKGNRVTDSGLPTHPLGNVRRQRTGQQAEQRLKDLEEEREEKEKARAEARKRLPGVGTPASLQEAYDRVDDGETLVDMGLIPSDHPSSSASANPFVAAVQNYIDSSPKNQSRLRTRVPFDQALKELTITHNNFQSYLGSLDKRAGAHDDSFDEDLRKGQAAVDARERDFRVVTEREKQKLIPDVGKPTSEPVDAALMRRKLGFDSDESRLSGYASLAVSPFDSWQANNILLEAAEIATRLAREGHFPLRSAEWDVFRHGYASARITMEYGPWAAKRLGDVNETKRRDNPAGEELMDLYNNNVGRKLAIDALTEAKPLNEVVLDSVRRGDYPALGGGRRDWPLEEIVLKAIRDGKFQMESFRLKQSAAPR